MLPYFECCIKTTSMLLCFTCKVFCVIRAYAHARYFLLAGLIHTVTI